MIFILNDKLLEGYLGCGIDGFVDLYILVVGGIGVGMLILGFGIGIFDISIDKEEVKRILIEN